MAKNDILLVDGIIEERMSKCLPSSNKGEVFEYLSFEQVTKDFDLTKDEILSCSVDGKDDGGIDAIFIFVNGILVTDKTDFRTLPKTEVSLSIYIITCKHEDTFRQDVVTKECSSIAELFDLSKKRSQLKSSYNKEVLDKRDIIAALYPKMALGSIRIKFYYCSRGDTAMIADNVKAQTERIKEIVHEMFSNPIVEYNFCGSSEILELYRRIPSEQVSIPFVDQLASGSTGCYIVLVNLYDYFKLISDDNGNIKQYLFDSNVRDFMGENNTNSDILNSLKKQDDVDFWWLNNGITILANSAISSGKSIVSKNIQIVNGLQTSVSVFNYFQNNPDITEDKRNIMVKIVSQTDAEIRDRIIRSTNNQTAIDANSLFATDKRQRDIEDIMKKEGLFYERRKNFYANQGKDANQIYDIGYLASGYVGLIQKNLVRAANFKPRHLKNIDIYSSIFNDDVNIKIWPAIAQILRRTDLLIAKKKSPSMKYTQSVSRRSRYVVAFITLARLMRKFHFMEEDLIKFDMKKYTDEEIELTWNFFRQYYERKEMLKPQYIADILQDAYKQWNCISDVAIVKAKYVDIMRCRN